MSRTDAAKSTICEDPQPCGTTYVLSRETKREDAFVDLTIC